MRAPILGGLAVSLAMPIALSLAADAGAAKKKRVIGAVVRVQFAGAAKLSIDRNFSSGSVTDIERRTLEPKWNQTYRDMRLIFADGEVGEAKTKGGASSQGGAFSVETQFFDPITGGASCRGSGTLARPSKPGTPDASTEVRVDRQRLKVLFVGGVPGNGFRYAWSPSGATCFPEEPGVYNDTVAGIDSLAFSARDLSLPLSKLRSGKGVVKLAVRETPFLRDKKTCDGHEPAASKTCAMSFSMTGTVTVRRVSFIKR